MDSRRIPRDKRKFLKYDSDRSGFTYFKRELVKDEGRWVHPDEFDEPPPHPKPIGGEGDVNTGEMRTNRNNYPAAQTEIWSP